MRSERFNNPLIDSYSGARFRAPDSFFVRVRALLLPILVSTFFTFGFAQALIIEDTISSEAIARFDLFEGESFSIGFVHSVNQSPVEETYQILEGKIWLISCLYYHFGAGVLTEVQPGQEMVAQPDGGMLIRGLFYEIDELLYIVGTVSDHVLKIKGKIVSLRELCGQNRKILLRYRK